MSSPRLYLITPILAEPAAFIAPLKAALEAGGVACVLLRTSVAGVVRKLAPVVQRRGIACLVGDPQLAAENRCDGVHVAGTGTALQAALAAMKPRRIVGVGGLATRHDAMSAGEADVDYLMFGAPDEREDFAVVRERIAWWAEIFNVPCVGYARSPGEVAALACAGADFVGLCDLVWSDRRGPAAAIEAATRALTHEPAA